MEKKVILDREFFRKIKSFDRAKMEEFLIDIYKRGANDVCAVPLDTSKLRSEIGAIKGVGESRLNEIMAVIEKHLEKKTEE